MSEKKKAAGVPGRDKTNKATIHEKNDAKSGQSRLFHKFEPIFDENSRILILGTFPSVKSREQDFYYAHPRNRFWNILSKLTQEPLPVTKEEKIELLLRNRIALWDVIESCEITGSSDSSIRNVVPAKLERVLCVPQIENIYANGTAAKRLYDRYQREQTGREIIGLPSTSPANAAWNLERLLKAWNCIIRE